MEHDGSLISRNMMQQVKASRTGAIEGTREAPILKQLCRHSASLCGNIWQKQFCEKAIYVLHTKEQFEIYFLIPHRSPNAKGKYLRFAGATHQSAFHSLWNLVSIPLTSGTWSPRGHEISHSDVVLDPQTLSPELPQGKKEAVAETAGSIFSSTTFGGMTQHIQYLTPPDGSLKAVTPSYKMCSSAEATGPKLVPSLGPAKAVNVPVDYNERKIGLAQFLYISANPILRGG